VAVDETLQVSKAATRTDEDVSVTQHLLRASIGEMTYQFLLHIIDIERGSLYDKLVREGIVLPSEIQKINAHTSAIDKVVSLLMMMGQKTAAEFESFLTVLSESGQQAVANAVQQALHVVGQRGQNPLQYISRKAQFINFK